jgi:hypothetical protein
MEKYPIKKATAMMTDGKKLPADSEMQKAVEQAKQANDIKRPASPPEPAATFTQGSSVRSISLQGSTSCQGKLRKNVMLIEDKRPSGTTFADAEELARYERLGRAHRSRRVLPGSLSPG